MRIYLTLLFLHLSLVLLRYFTVFCNVFFGWPTFELYLFVFLWREPLTDGAGQEMDACLEENRWSWTPALHLRGLFGVQECLQGSNWKIRSAKGAKALRDKQWGDEAWIRITHAGKCGEIEREREGKKHRHGLGMAFFSTLFIPLWHHRCITPQNYCCDDRVHLRGTISTCLHCATLKKWIYVFTADELFIGNHSRYINRKLLAAPPVGCESHLRSLFTPPLVFLSLLLMPSITKSYSWEAIKTVFSPEGLNKFLSTAR